MARAYLLKGNQMTMKIIVRDRGALSISLRPKQKGRPNGQPLLALLGSRAQRSGSMRCPLSLSVIRPEP